MFARKADRFAKPQPGVDPAGIIAITVVVKDALHPHPARGAVGAIGKNRSVLDRDADLVIKTVRHPTADLLAGRAARVEHDVERMMDVIPITQPTQARLEFFTAPGRFAHSSISMPS